MRAGWQKQTTTVVLSLVPAGPHGASKLSVKGWRSPPQVPADPLALSQRRPWSVTSQFYGVSGIGPGQLTTRDEPSWGQGLQGVPTPRRQLCFPPWANQRPVPGVEPRLAKRA